MADFPISVNAGALSATGYTPVSDVANVSNGSMATVAMTSSGELRTGNVYNMEDPTYLYYYMGINMDVTIDGATGTAIDAYLEIDALQLSALGGPAETLPEFDAYGELVTGGLARFVLDAPDFVSSGTIASGYIITGNAVLNELEVYAADGNSLQIALPDLSLDSELKTGIVAAGVAFTLPMAATGQVLSDGNSIAELALPAIVVSGVAQAGVVHSAAISLPVFSTTGSLATGVLASASVPLPAITLSAELYSDITIDGALDLTVLVLEAIGVTDSGHVIYDATPARVMNVSNKAITEYMNYGFNSFASFGNNHYGASESGIYLLSGPNDNGTPIGSRVVLGVTDFGTPYYKRVEYAYIAYSTDGNMRLRLTTDSNDMYEYFMAPTGKSRHHSARVSLARGARTRYIQAELLNDSGADFTISNIELVGAISNKRM